MDMPMADEQDVTTWLTQAETVTVLTGAGISTDSGIPDFRGPQGVWTKDPAAAALFTIDNYLADPDVRRRAWQGRLHHPVWQATPSPGHRALVALEHAGRLGAVVTQNIDGLHQRAGHDPTRVLELHGTVHQVRCLSCGLRTPMRAVLRRVADGEADPPCAECGGIQKSDTVSFGEQLDPRILAAAQQASAGCDLFLAVGTSLTVHPAAGLCAHARAAGARLVIVNAEPTPYDQVADAVLREPIGEAMPRLTGQPTAAITSSDTSKLE